MKVLVVADGRFLLLAHKPTGGRLRWSIPTGDWRLGEPIDDAAKRIVAKLTGQVTGQATVELGEVDSFSWRGQRGRSTAVAMTLGASPERVQVPRAAGYVWQSVLDDPEGSDDIIDLSEVLARYRDTPAGQTQVQRAVLEFAAEISALNAILEGPADPVWWARERPGYARRIPVLNSWLEHAGVPDRFSARLSVDAADPLDEPGPARKRLASLLNEAIKGAESQQATASSPEEVNLAREAENVYRVWASAAGVELATGDSPEGGGAHSDAWHRGTEVPADVQVVWVGVFVFDALGRIAVFEDEDTFRLPRGRPELADGASWEATARREVARKVGVSLLELSSLGWLAVPSNAGQEGPLGADVRMVARLDQVFPAGLDPFSGRVRVRRVMAPHRALMLLGERDSVPRMIVDAVAEAERRWGVRAGRVSPEAALATFDLDPSIGVTPGAATAVEPVRDSGDGNH
jgi:ADP-ribose pyrophosphatase YjhB (NUDIX family)